MNFLLNDHPIYKTKTKGSLAYLRGKLRVIEKPGQNIVKNNLNPKDFLVIQMLL